MIKILYANSNHDNNQYINECIVSAKSFRKYVPDASIELYTNTADREDEVFDKVHNVEFVVPKKLLKRDHKRGQMLVKMNAMLDTESEHNLYLGCDTFALDKMVNEPFKLLSRYDFALVHAPSQHKLKTSAPHCYREWNCDVIYWRNTQNTKDFIREWKRLYENDLINHAHDQGSFRHLAWETPDISVFTLPYHYNNRCGMFGAQYSGKSVDWDLSNSVIIQNRDVVRKIQNDKS